MKSSFIPTERLYEKDLGKAAKLLLDSEVVAFPTETVYGLGARLFSEEAISSIFRVKGRPSDNPLIVHVGDLSSIEEIAREIPPVFYSLFEKFSPGPLTYVLRKAEKVPLIVSGGLDTVAVRMPNHPLALELIRLVKEPLVAPSANLSGKPSATSVDHVLEDFEGKIPAVVMGDACQIGIESTVLSLLEGKVEILRPGAISQEEIEQEIKQKITVFTPHKNDLRALPSPGMKYRHYAPLAKVVLTASSLEALDYCKKNSSSRKMSLSAGEDCFSHLALFIPLSSFSFYASLRLADQLQLEEIIVVCDPLIQKNKGLMNRIEKASGL